MNLRCHVPHSVQVFLLPVKADNAIFSSILFLNELGINNFFGMAGTRVKCVEVARTKPRILQLWAGSANHHLGPTGACIFNCSVRQIWSQLPYWYYFHKMLAWITLNYTRITQYYARTRTMSMTCRTCSTSCFFLRACRNLSSKVSCPERFLTYIWTSENSRSTMMWWLAWSRLENFSRQAS